MSRWDLKSWTTEDMGTGSSEGLWVRSPDGRVLAPRVVMSDLADPRKELQLWDAATLRPLGSPLRHDGHVQCLAFSPDGQRLLTGSHDRQARLWDVATGELLLSPLPHEDFISEVAFAPDGRTILTESGGRVVRLWDASTGAPRSQPLRHDADVARRGFADGGRMLYTITQGESRQHISTKAEAVVHTPTKGGTVRLWDAATGRPLARPLPVSAGTADLPAIASLAGNSTSTAEVTDAGDLLDFTEETHTLLRRPPVPFGGDEAEVRRRVEALTGLRLNEDGSVRLLVSDEWFVVSGEKTAPSSPLTPGRARAAQFAAAREATADQDWFAACWHLDRLLAASSDGALLRRRAVARFHLRRWEEALADCTAAAAAGQEDAELFRVRGWCSALLGRGDAAVQDFERLRLDSPNDLDAGPNLYFAYARRGDMARANAALARATRPMLFHFAGTAPPEDGRWLEAADRFTDAIDTGLADWWVWSGRAEIYAGSALRAEALADLDGAVAARPDDLRLRDRRAHLCSELGRHEDVVRECTHALDLDPKNLPLRSLRAQAFRELQQWDKVLGDLDEVLKAKPKEVAALSARAEAYVAQERWKEAMEDLEKAVGLSPQDEQLWSRLALLCLRVGDQLRYQVTCDRIHKAFGGTSPTSPQLNRLVWTFALGADSLPNPEMAPEGVPDGDGQTGRPAARDRAQGRDRVSHRGCGDGLPAGTTGRCRPAAAKTRGWSGCGRPSRGVAVPGPGPPSVGRRGRGKTMARESGTVSEAAARS
jgi:tetratricopeptide (TPR) repeat protein